MPYHIFQKDAFQQLTFVKSVADYRSAKNMISELRESPDNTVGSSYRMMHATDPAAAERLLKEKREARPMGEHN